MTRTTISRNTDSTGSQRTGDDDRSRWTGASPIERLFRAYYRLTGENLAPEIIKENDSKTGQKAMGENP